MRLGLTAAAAMTILACCGCSGGSEKPGAPPSRASVSPQDDSSPTSGTGESGAGDESEGISLNFRPVLSSRPADAGAPADMPQEFRQVFAATDCESKPNPASARKSVVACDASDTKHLLAPAIVTDSLTGASAMIYEGEWVVAILVDKSAQKLFKTFDDEVSRPTVLAFERGGQVLGTRNLDQLVQKGRSDIRGGLNKRSAGELERQLMATVQ